MPDLTRKVFKIITIGGATVRVIVIVMIVDGGRPGASPCRGWETAAQGTNSTLDDN